MAVTKTVADVKILNGATTTLRRHRRRRNNHHHSQLTRLRHPPPRLPRSPEAAVGQMGVWNSGATQEVAHMARLLPGAGDGGEGLRRRRLLSERPEGAAQLPRRGKPPAAPATAVRMHRQGHPGGGGKGSSHDDEGLRFAWEKRHCFFFWRRQRRRWLLGWDRAAGAHE